MTLSIRSIEQADDQQLAQIIRTVLEEFGANRPGTVYYDASTDQLSTLFSREGSAYFTVYADQQLIGGAGIFPTEGLPDGTCELVKMYLLSEFRGKGIGRQLVQHCLQTAVEKGYQTCYLETMPELQAAQHIYKKNGFEYLTGPMGKSGHFGCDIWMKKNL